MFTHIRCAMFGYADHIDPFAYMPINHMAVQDDVMNIVNYDICKRSLYVDPGM